MKCFCPLYSNQNIAYLPFCFSFIVCCNKPAQGLPEYLLHNDKNGIMSALFEYHCLLAAAAAATEAIDVAMLELFKVEDTDDVTNVAFMIFYSFVYIFDMSLEVNQKAEPLLTNMTFVFFCHFRHFDSKAL